MSQPGSTFVALLIDFENLVRGVEDSDDLDVEPLFRFADEHGSVVVANAYADWRSRDVNQHQVELYRLGAELIHVFGKRSGGTYKNAVDVKMAVDAVSAMSMLPHVDVYVIVSGDRDFIHVLKALRRHGKRVIGVSPAASSSEDFATLCDRFVRYESLAATYGDVGVGDAETSAEEIEGLQHVREALRDLVAKHPDGIKGAQIKPLLRRELSATFDESDYGYSRLTDLLRAMGDVVALDHPENGSDVVVRPAGATDHVEAAPETSLNPKLRRLVTRAGLANYRFDQNAARRRGILKLIADAAGDSAFTWDQVTERVATARLEVARDLSLTVLNKYRTVLYQARVFDLGQGQESLPFREREMRLRAEYLDFDKLVAAYERSVAYKLANAADEDPPLEESELAEILGLEAGDPANRDYCRELLSSL